MYITTTMKHLSTKSTQNIQYFYGTIFCFNSENSDEICTCDDNLHPTQITFSCHIQWVVYGSKD